MQLSGLTMKRFDEALDEHLTSLEERLGLGEKMLSVAGCVFL